MPRLLGLVVLLNVVRYVVAAPIAMATVTGPMFEVMEARPELFNDYDGPDSAFLWTTSYAYNFALWMVAAWMHHLARPALAGGEVSRSLQVYGLMWAAFAATSAVYMNHFHMPRAFWGAGILDAAVAFGVVGLANVWLYPLVMGPARNDGR